MIKVHRSLVPFFVLSIVLLAGGPALGEALARVFTHELAAGKGFQGSPAQNHGLSHSHFLEARLR